MIAMTGNLLHDALLEPEPCPVEPELLARLVMAICDGGRYRKRCTWPDCPHWRAKARAVEAWKVMEAWRARDDA